MKSTARQRQILQCAKKVFAERGFHAANISHICAEAGIGRGTLYQYFGNKKAVFEAILHQTLDRIQRVMEDRVLARMPRPENLQRDAVTEWAADRMRDLLRVAFEDDHTLRILLREAVGLDVDIEATLSQIDQGLIAIVASDLAAAQQAGIVRADVDPTLTATLMVGGVEKLALTALRSDQPVDLDGLARQASRLHTIGVLSNRIGN